MRAHISQQIETVHAKITVKPFINRLADNKLGHLSRVSRNFKFLGEVTAKFGKQTKKRFVFSLAGQMLYAPLC